MRNGVVELGEAVEAENLGGRKMHKCFAFSLGLLILGQLLPLSAREARETAKDKAYRVERYQGMLKVREAHPRLFITPERVGELRRRMEYHPAWNEVKNLASQGDARAAALCYLLTKDNKMLSTAYEKALSGGFVEPSLVFDWCFEGLSAEQKAKLIEAILAKRSNRLFYTGACTCKAGETASYPQLIPPIALAYHKPGIVEELDRGGIRSLMGHLDNLEDGTFHSGYWLCGSPVRFTGWWETFMLLKSGLGIDYFTDERPYAREMGNYILYQYHPLASKSTVGHPLALARYGDYIPHGDFNRIAAFGFRINSETNNPYYQWLIEEVLLPYKRGGPIEHFLYYDPKKEKKHPKDGLYPAHFFKGQGLVVMRSGWEEKDVWFSILYKGAFAVSNHSHTDAGSFIISKKGYLVPDSGHYNEYQFTDYWTHHNHPEAHNLVLFGDPYPSELSYAQLRGAGRYFSGEVKSFQTHKYYDYCAGTLGGEAKWTRQVVFVRNGTDGVYIIIFDRVLAPGKKAWLCHLVEEPSILDGKLIEATVKGHDETYSGSVVRSSSHEGSVFYCYSLYPAEKRIVKLGGEGWECSVNRKPQLVTPAGRELLKKYPWFVGNWRIEVYPQHLSNQDYFLNLFYVPWEGEGKKPEVKLRQEPDKLGLSVSESGIAFTLDFWTKELKAAMDMTTKSGASLDRRTLE